MADKPSDATASKLLERWHDGLKACRRPHRTYWLNRAYVLGQQWITWDNQSQRLNRIPPPKGRQRITVNLLAEAKRTQLGKLLRRPLVFEVKPDTADDVAVRGARMSEKLLGQIARDQTWESVRRDALDILITAGTSAVCTMWDTTVGDSLGESDTGRKVSVGDVALEALAAPQMVIEPGCSDANRAGWWIKVAADSPRAVQDRFGLKVAPKADAGMQPWRWLLPGDETLDDGAPGGSDGGRVLVYTMFQRPGKGRTGRVCTVVDGATVEEMPWPFPFTDRLNLRVFREVPIPGVWWGQSMMSAAVPLQFEYNSARSQILEHRRKVGVARLWVPDPAFDEADYTDEIGVAIPYSPVAGKAEWAPPPELPRWMVEQPNVISDEINRILATHRLSDEHGQVDSGVGLSILAERDDTPLGVTAVDQSDGWAGVGRDVLEVWAKMRPDLGRRVIVDDELGRPQSATVGGKELGGQFDVTVPLDAVLPRSRAATQAWAIQLMQAGFFNGPDGRPDLRRFAVAADLPGRDDLLAGLAPDVEKAKRENEAMARGEPRVPASFDVHAVHVADHDEFRKSARFEELDATAQELFALHVQAHETMMGEEMGRQAAMSQGGAPDLAAAVASMAGGKQGNVLPFAPPPMPPMLGAGPGSVDPALAAGAGAAANTFGQAGTP